MQKSAEIGMDVFLTLRHSREPDTDNAGVGSSS